MDGGAWWAAVHGVAMSWTRLSDFTFTFQFHALEKEMATCSGVLAWRIPGTRGASWAAVYGVAQSRTRLKLLSSKCTWNVLQKRSYIAITKQVNKFQKCEIMSSIFSDHNGLKLELYEK